MSDGVILYMFKRLTTHDPCRTPITLAERAHAIERTCRGLLGVVWQFSQNRFSIPHPRIIKEHDLLQPRHCNPQRALRPALAPPCPFALLFFPALPLPCRTCRRPPPTDTPTPSTARHFQTPTPQTRRTRHTCAVALGGFLCGHKVDYRDPDVLKAVQLLATQEPRPVRSVPRYR